MDHKNIEVHIFGEDIVLITNEDKENIVEISSYVDEKMNELFRNRKVSIEKPIYKTILLGVNIANDLFRAKKKITALENQIKKAQASGPSVDSKELIGDLQNRIKDLEQVNEQLLVDLKTLETNQESQQDKNEIVQNIDFLEEEKNKMEEKVRVLEEENAELKKILKQCEKEKQMIKNELDEFIETFDTDKKENTNVK